MKDVAALVLAIAALASSILLWFRRPEPATSAPPPAATVSVDPPKVKLAPRPPATPDMPASCPGEGKATTLVSLMKNRINPMMTQMSFGIFHDRDNPDALAAVASNAAGMLSCIHLSPSVDNEIDIRDLDEFYDLLGRAQADTLAIHVAALEGDREAAKHWFSHLKQDCLACHARFRVETEVEAEAEHADPPDSGVKTP